MNRLFLILAITVFLSDYNLPAATVSTSPSPSPLPSDPHFLKQWALTGIMLTEPSIALETPTISAWRAWKTYRRCSMAPIAILSTGVDYGNLDLSTALSVDRAINKNFVKTTLGSNASDDHGEGTFLTGIIGAGFNNGRHVAGICSGGSRIIPIKTLNSQGQGTWAAMAAGIRYAVSTRSKVILISSGAIVPDHNSSELQNVKNALTEAQSAGALVIVPSSPSNEIQSMSSRLYFPASLKLSNMISVSAVDVNYELIGGIDSSKVDIAAPGVNVVSTFLNSQDGARYGSGPAVAAAHVAAAAAMYWDKNPTARSCSVKKAILSTATKASLDQQNKNLAKGWLNLERLIALSIPAC